MEGPWPGGGLLGRDVKLRMNRTTDIVMCRVAFAQVLLVAVVAVSAMVMEVWLLRQQWR